MKPITRYHTIIESPVGDLHLVFNDTAVSGLYFSHSNKQPDFTQYQEKAHHPLIKKVRTQLKEYFQGTREKFDLPLDLQGSPFQIQAWKQLQKIPYGKAISYSEQATKMGNPKWTRAVGGANGRNPISIIIPCHRVIGKNGTLTGFGGGVDRKEFLLKLEQNQDLAT